MLHVCHTRLVARVVRRCGLFTRLTAEQLVFIFEYQGVDSFKAMLTPLNPVFGGRDPSHLIEGTKSFLLARVPSP